MATSNGDYVESTVAGYITQATTFSTVTSAAFAAYDLTAIETGAFGSGLTALVNAETAYQLGADAARALLATRDAALDSSQAMFRDQVQVIQSSPAVTNTRRQAAGVRIRSTTRTPVGVPTVAPMVAVERIDRLSHTLRFTFLGHAGRGRPAGVEEFRLYYKVGGEAPTDLSQCQFAGATSKTTFTKTFAGPDGNKTVYYIVVAVNPTGAAGPMSETLSASIAA